MTITIEVGTNGAATSSRRTCDSIYLNVHYCVPFRKKGLGLGLGLGLDLVSGSITRLFVPLTIRTMDYSYHRPFVPLIYFVVVVNLFVHMCKRE